MPFLHRSSKTEKYLTSLDICCPRVSRMTNIKSRLTIFGRYFVLCSVRCDILKEAIMALDLISVSAQKILLIAEWKRNSNSLKYVGLLRKTVQRIGYYWTGLVTDKRYRLIKPRLMKPGLEDYLFFSISFLFFLLLFSLFLHPLSDTYIGKLLAFNQNCYQLAPLMAPCSPRGLWRNWRWPWMTQLNHFLSDNDKIIQLSTA